MYEEMRRTLEYCRWQSRWWGERAAERQGLSPDLQEGIAAYAWEHADLEQRFAQDLEGRWDVIRRRAKEFIDAGFDESQDDAGTPSSAPPHVETVTLNLRELQALDDDDDDDN